MHDAKRPEWDCKTPAGGLNMSQQVIVIPFSGQLIGQGYNSQTGENVGTALEVDSVAEYKVRIRRH
jgi:hypothetical protein